MTRNLTQVAGSFIGTMEEFHAPEKKPLVSSIIHITDSQTGKILDTIPLGDFWDDNHHKSLKDTLEYFEFRTFGDKRYSQHLEKMNRIIIPDEDGTFIEFVIFHAIKYRLQNAVVVDVYAPASYLLLKKAKVIKPQRVSEYTASQHLGFALNGTEWRPGIVESDKYRTIDIENHTNPYAYIKRIANEFELEPRFRVETDGNKVIGRYVDLLERVGEWQGREVEFGRDLLGIERKVDDSNVVTALIGLGPERDDGTRLEVMVEDEEALQRWGIPNPQTGELMHLIETYEPESTDQDMTIERLTVLTRNELEKRINSVVEYTADVADLEKVPGMENKVIRFGDTIKIKDTSFNPPLYLEARVHTQDRSLSQPEKKKVTLGDYIEYTEEEVQAIWRQLQSEVRRRITAKQLYDYTYSKLVIDSKDEEVRTDVESYARTVAADAKNEAITYTNNTFEPIAVRVDSVEEDIKNHQELISKAQTDIIQAYNEIELRATKAEVDTLSGRVNQAESQITQLAGQIELRATKTEVDELTGRVSTVESTIQQHADMIESKIDDGQARSIFRQEASSFTFEADQINFKGHVFGEDATFVGELSTGIINTNEVYIGKKTLPFWEHFSSRIVMKNVIRITDDEFMDGEPFVIEVGNGDALISTPGSLELVANTVTIPGDIRLSDEGFVYTSAIDNHDAHASPHIYIRPRDANSEVRATVTGTTTEYVKVRAREFVAGGINGDGIFSADNSIAVLRAGPDNYAFVQSDLEVRATRRFSGSSYIPVRASSFPSGSLEEFKTNIKKWEESALDIIRNADIYEFNLKNDLEVGKNKKRYGLVIGDGYRTPEQVIDDDGVEQYAMNSISWKAIQELDTEQQELKGRIAWLEAENKLLREKIKKLEGMIS